MITYMMKLGKKYF